MQSVSGGLPWPLWGSRARPPAPAGRGSRLLDDCAIEWLGERLVSSTVHFTVLPMESAYTTGMGQMRSLVNPHNPPESSRPSQCRFHPPAISRDQACRQASAAMRTTLHIADDLYRRTKAAAALRGCSVTSVIEETLRFMLSQETPSAVRPVRVLNSPQF